MCAADLLEKGFQFKTFSRSSLLHSMILISNSRACVLSTLLLETLRLKFFSYKISAEGGPLPSEERML